MQCKLYRSEVLSAKFASYMSDFHLSDVVPITPVFTFTRNATCLRFESKKQSSDLLHGHCTEANGKCRWPHTSSIATRLSRDR